jgi:hypothetical protein
MCGLTSFAVLASSGDLVACLPEHLEPVLTPALHTELSVEAPDGAVLHKSAQLNEDA